MKNKYFNILAIFIIYIINIGVYGQSQFKNIGNFQVIEQITPKYSISHTMFFARTEGQQFALRVRNKDNIISSENTFNDPNKFTSVTVNQKQIYQLYQIALAAQYIRKNLFFRVKKHLFFAYGAGGGSLGLAIEPGELKTNVVLEINGQEYQFTYTSFNQFVKALKPVADLYGPTSGRSRLSILGFKR